jgi:hypothetical protein
MSISIYDDHLELSVDGFSFYVTETKVLMNSLDVLWKEIDKEKLEPAIVMAREVRDAWGAYLSLNIWLANQDYPSDKDAFAAVFREYPREKEHIKRLIENIEKCPIWYIDFRSMWHEDIKAALENQEPTYVGSGYVYILEGKDGYYKIGKSVNPEVRIKTLGVVLPFEITPIHLIECQNHHRVERDLHMKYNLKRTAGEWFKLEPADIKYIKSLKHVREDQEL